VGRKTTDRATDDWQKDLEVLKQQLEQDVVKHPSHYTSHPSGIEVIKITQHETFLRGNIIKYVLRAPYKGSELEDLKKARQYLDWEIEQKEAAIAASEVQ
jgi:hypothetical protein